VFAFKILLFVFRFVLCAVSPAVVVPSLLYLQDKGYGVEGGIPTFLIAGAALNDVIGITGFNVVLGMIFSEGRTSPLRHKHSKYFISLQYFKTRKKNHTQRSLQ